MSDFVVTSDDDETDSSDEEIYIWKRKTDVDDNG